ncbi:MAG: hypothetical protein ACT4N9_04145 [Paracoccaceae bacterium]
MDHSHDTAPASGPWAGGWLISALAGLFAAAVAFWIGGTGAAPAAAVGVLTLVVHGVLLGAGGVEQTAVSGHEGGHDHGHH